MIDVQALLAGGVLIASLACAQPQPGEPAAKPAPPEVLVHQAKNPNPTAAYRWLDIALEATAREVDRNAARPTIIARTLQIALNGMYDAWAAYDDKALGSRLGGKLRRPPAERTEKNAETAIAYGTYRTLLFVYAEDAPWIREQMTAMGFDPDDDSRDPSTPAGVGNLAAQAIIDHRAHDGANQLGDEPGSNGKPYSDYTYYSPVNTQDRMVDPDRWFPIPFADGKGGKKYVGFLTPHWYRVKPFALDRSDMFRAPPPPKVGSEEMKRDVEECIQANANLSLEEKALVEFMRDGPRSTGQSGHWLRFAQDVSRRDHNTLAQDVKLFFTIGNVCFDAFIACWETKRYYDNSRPYHLVRYYIAQYYGGKTIRGWLGPGKGVGDIPAEQWHPYSPDTFVTPPFAGYTSGHATVSGAAAKMLELFTGSDRYGAVERRKAGCLTEAEFAPSAMQMCDGKSPADCPATCDVELQLPTFSATAEMAARSRMLGGYHVSTDNVEGLKMGRKLAEWSWPKYQALFDGTGPLPGTPAQKD